MPRHLALLLGAALALTACSAGDPADPAPAEAAEQTEASEAPRTAELRAQPEGTTAVPGSGGADLALATSAALYDAAPVVVLAPTGDADAVTRASEAAVELGAPLLLTPAAAPPPSTPTSPSSAPPSSAPPSSAPPSQPPTDPVGSELERLGTETVLTVGAPATAWAEQQEELEAVAAPADAAGLAELLRGDLADAEPAQPLTGVVALVSASTPESAAAVATARAAGVEVLTMAQPDPRADPAVIAALRESSPTTVLALGDDLGDPERVGARVAVAKSGTELPAGGQLILPGKRYVALYGHPSGPALGVLGEQGVDATIARAKGLAAEYTAAGSAEPVVPTLEVITTVASASAGPDGNYSTESPIAQLLPLVEAAGREGVYVVLDLQPGYTDFLSQAKQYEQLLALPHVGLALDPEWRLKPGQRHMKQIGQVGADEVNSVVDWLATFTRERALPQKLLLLHQFQVAMLQNREAIDVSRDELSVITQMDGHGSPSLKTGTWNAIRVGAPSGMTFGWKNFYDEDSPTFTPAQTLAVQPTPVFVSYQ